MNFSLTYNNYTIDNANGVIVNTISGLNTIEIRTSEDMLTGTDGGAIWEQFYGMRNISITGVVHGADAATYFANKQLLTKAFSLNGNGNLYITTWDGVTRYIPAKVIGMPDIQERQGEPTRADFQVQLRCPDPFFREENEQSLTIQLSEAGGFPLASPVSTPIPFDSSFGTITISGSVASNPVYTITGPVTNPSVRNTNTNKFFTVNTVVGAGETLIVQLVGGVLDVKQGAQNKIADFTGHFIPLQVGTNTIRFTSSVFTEGASLNVTYRNNYLGL
jgi:hypothetical protein